MDSLRKFRVILWKNFLVRKRHAFLMLVEIIIPIGLFFLVSYARSKIPDFSKQFVNESTTVDPIPATDISTRLNIRELNVLYAPKTDFTRHLLRQVQLKLSLYNEGVQGFRSEGDVMSHYNKHDGKGVTAVILFTDVGNSVPTKLTYDIRIYEEYVFWNTDRLFQEIREYVPGIVLHLHDECSVRMINAVMANEEQNENITIHDWENNTQYTLLLNHQDCLRAETDAAFANSLLFHARVMTRSEKTAVVNANYSSEVLATSASEESENGKQLGTWGYTETITLIHSMGVHMEDLNHPKRRKEVFDHVSNDLVSSGYSFNIEAIKNKWKSLNRSYTKAKDNKNLSGRAPSRFMFYDEMDETVGNKPTNQCNHSLNSLDDKVQEESNNTELENDCISTENSSDDTGKMLHNKEKTFQENFRKKSQKGIYRDEKN